MGKYLNGYAPRKVVDGRRNFVPPGWTEWAGVPTGGDPDFNYNDARQRPLGARADRALRQPAERAT